ncbi:hypothetical protein [Sphingopyxis sp. PET50]|uniref:hypothetical protein n=1 Tax=Sphingopyxis sp. PET50 TaxID=2976533 RepID=UPI0021AFBD62|nr:hypothetical protein [Sphingopyxis sp. PET50]
MLAALIERFTPEGQAPIAGAAAFQLADGLARVIDQLHYEEVAVPELVDLDLGAFAGHWQASLGRLRLLVDHWSQRRWRGRAPSIGRNGATACSTAWARHGARRPRRGSSSRRA